MPIKSKNILKSYFENGDKPNEAQFSDLIDSLVHVNESGSNTGGTGGAGSGVIEGISTDTNGNLVFTFTSGDSINISSNGSVGTVKMPIPYVDSYDNFYFVSEEKGDNSKAFPNSYRFYKTIVAASEAARKNFDATGNKNMVYVFKGTYNEESVNREHVDMYFEDGAVCWVDGFDKSVINDKLEAVVNANVYGKGTFVNKQYDSYDDREGINMRQASSMYIEAKLVDGIQLYNDDRIHFDFANMIILHRISSHKNKSMKFTNCVFPNGLRVTSFKKDGGKEVFENCEFIVPEFTTSDARNKSVDILNYNGELLFRHRFNDTNDDQLDPIDTKGLTSDYILNEVYQKYTLFRQEASPEVSCIMYSENDHTGFNLGNYKLEIRNSRCIIKKENAFGIILSKRQNSANTEGYVIIDDLIIVDETKSKNSIALVTGWGDRATQQPELMVNALSHNCKTDQKKIAPNLKEWKITFNQIPAFVPKTGGRFSGSLSITDDKNSKHYPGIYLAPDGTFSTSHKIPTGVGIGGGLSVSNIGNGIVGLDFRAKPDDYSGDQTVQMSYYQDEKTIKNPVHSLQMFQPNSLMVIGGWLGQESGLGGYKENDKFRVLNGDAEIDGELRTKSLKSNSIFENGIRVATQTWVNTAIASLVAANTKASDADKLDGIDSTQFARQESIPSKTLKIGWYTIAVNVGNRASAKFVLRETRSGRHGSIHFYAAHNYGNGNVITVQSNSYHSGGGAIRYLRLKESGTYDGVVLQAYIDTDDAPVSGIILEDIQTSGWTAKSWIADATDPKGLKDYKKLTNIAVQIDLDKTQGIHTSSDIYVNSNLVLHEGNDVKSKGTYYWGDNKRIIQFSDHWLRLNPTGHFKSGIYCGNKTLRTDGQFEVGSGGKYFRVKTDGTTDITGKTTIYGDTQINGKTLVNGEFLVGLGGKSLKIKGDGIIDITGKTTIYGDSQVNGDTVLNGELRVGLGGSKFKVESNGNANINGNGHVNGSYLSGKTTKGGYTHLYRFGGIHFTWDSKSYGTNAQHSIRSTYGTKYGDSLTMNSFNNIRLNIDSNNNNKGKSRFEIGHKTSGLSNILFTVDESGNTTASGNVTAYSDRRLKKALKPVTDSFLDKIEKLKPTYYHWKDKSKEQTQQLGFIAQDVMEVFPEWVHQGKDHYSMSYDKMGAVLAVKGIQELYSEIKKLKSQIKELQYGITC